MELKEYKLGDIAEIITGVSYTPNDITTSGIRILRGGNIQAETVLLKDDDVFLPMSYANNNQLKKYDTIIVSSTGSVDALAKGATIFEDLPNTQIGAFLRIIRPKEEKYAMIISMWCTSPFFRQYMIKKAKGTSINNIRTDFLTDFPILIPEDNNLEHTSKLYLNLESKLLLNRQINQNLEALARQLYDYWFVQFDFPNEEGKPYKSSGGKMVYNPILKREIPEGWEMKEMEEIIDIKSGFPFQSTTYLSKGKYSIITIKNVQDGFLDLSGTDFLDELPPRIPDYCILKRGDILISLTGNIGRVGRVFSDNLLLNQRVGYVDCKNQYNNWAYLYITSSQVRLQIEKLGIGSAQLNVSPIQIGKIKLALPTDQVLSSFDKKLAAILEHILANSNEIASLTKQRDELLPLLMNGQVNFDLSAD